VSVDFIVIQGHFRLIWVIVICSILGGVVGYLLGRPPKRTRHQRSDGDLPRE
jgi:membrane protein YqaA with SNARE-associated domain